MNINKILIQKMQRVYKKEFNREITDLEAWILLLNLTTLFDINLGLSTPKEPFEALGE